MNVVFCSTCKGRVQHLAQTLPRNIADNPNAKFVVLSYNDTTGLAGYIREYHAEDIESGRLVVYHYCEPVSFRMAHAKNMAHRCGMLEGGDILVNMDADNFAEPGFADWIMEQFVTVHGLNEDIFAWPRMVKEGEGRLAKGISGRIGVTKTAFLLTGGYDEKYTTHSPDDKDFDARLRRMGIERREIPSKFLHAILHNDKMRFREYPHALTAAIGEESNISPDATVVNGGNIGCGTVYRNFGPDPIKIKPLPTRILGCGMHKTGTTSLHHAFQILGFESAHWQTAPWAKAVWREATQGGKSPTLEKFYCACDLPIALVYQQLDRAYPGSKFVLTIRDEWSWLTSVRNHWDPARNQFRYLWEIDAFTHRLHNLLYGRKDFDPTTMLERYRRHNAEVIEYFKGREDDLLIMDMEKGRAGWPELCGFLDLPVPNEPYPHMLKTK